MSPLGRRRQRPPSEAVADNEPIPAGPVDDEEAAALRAAIELRTAPPAADLPRPEFVEGLRRRLGELESAGPPPRLLVRGPAAVPPARHGAAPPDPSPGAPQRRRHRGAAARAGLRAEPGRVTRGRSRRETAHAASGSVSRKAAPAPSAGGSRTRSPSWARAMRRAMARPRPAPPERV